MAVVQNIADTVAVMYLGKLMEIAPAKDLFRSPKHPYTTALLSAIPVPEVARERKRIILQGDMPSPLDPPSGCVFRTRCSQAIEHCAEVVPALTQTSPGRWVACHLHQTTLTESL
jgi:ABC-type dipeptide/oligopeptide/nickel transport system ATPase component